MRRKIMVGALRLGMRDRSSITSRGQLVRQPQGRHCELSQAEQGSE